jgi:hypothetical protein
MRQPCAKLVFSFLTVASGLPAIPQAVLVAVSFDSQFS